MKGLLSARFRDAAHGVLYEIAVWGDQDVLKPLATDHLPVGTSTGPMPAVYPASDAVLDIAVAALVELTARMTGGRLRAPLEGAKIAFVEIAHFDPIPFALVTARARSSFAHALPSALRQL